MKKPEFTTYTLEEIQKKGKIRKPTNPMSYAESRIREHVPISVDHNDDGISDELSRLLHTNPFMYNKEKSLLQVSSIEEFYITNKKLDLQFGTVIRGDNYSRFKKKSILKKALANWKNDFELNKKQLLNLNADQIFVVGDVTTPKISFGYYILFFIIFFIISFFMFRPGEVWDKAWIEKINTGLTNAFGVPWVNTVSYIGLYIVIIAIFSSFMYNEIIRNFNRLSNEAPIIYARAKARIDKDFKEKYVFTRKYYLKAASRFNATIPTLTISKTSIGETDFEDVQKMTDSYVQKSANLKRKKLLMRISNILTIYLPILFGVVIGGYIIYSIIVSFF